MAIAIPADMIVEPLFRLWEDATTSIIEVSCPRRDKIRRRGHEWYWQYSTMNTAVIGGKMERRATLRWILEWETQPEMMSEDVVIFYSRWRMGSAVPRQFTAISS
mmetsp:Transcript_41893/g.87946  ORF Transcript_41893/g.87946 Transcript_41893/m.87946 type:complete len:105 (+) Transcript_41893:196-510(+)